MSGTVIIDCFPECAARYRSGHAVVAIDVVRATTTAITAVAAGRRCFVVPTVEAAFRLAAKLDHPLLVGEQRGVMPEGFDINNSPAALLARDDLHRPAILLSSSGTRLCHEAQACEAAYLACLRNYASVARHLAGRFANIAVIGAGTKGEFREEDQMCCAWVADILTDLGYQPDGRTTEAIIERWRGATAEDWVHGKSAAYLRRSGQLEDLEFILDHVDDLDALFALRDGEVIVQSSATRAQSPVKECADAV
jgi:2-phosphosulfolactate phosphatase